MADGVHTLAIGHTQVTAAVQQDRIENPGGDAIYTEAEARKKGLLWSRRKGAEKRADLILTPIEEETEEDAVEAGRQMRANIIDTLRQLPDLPDRYNPEDARPPRRRHSPSRDENTTRTKFRRVQLASENGEEEAEMDQAEAMDLNPDRELLETRALVQGTRDTIANIDQIFVDVQESEIDYAREHSFASARRRPRTRRAHGFILDEAEEGNECQTPSPSLDTSGLAGDDEDSDLDSLSNIDPDDSFIVEDDFFEEFFLKIINTDHMY